MTLPNMPSQPRDDATPAAQRSRLQVPQLPRGHSRSGARKTKPRLRDHPSAPRHAPARMEERLPATTEITTNKKVAKHLPDVLLHDSAGRPRLRSSSFHRSDRRHNSRIQQASRLPNSTRLRRHAALDRLSPSGQHRDRSRLQSNELHSRSHSQSKHASEKHKSDDLQSQLQPTITHNTNFENRRF